RKHGSRRHGAQPRVGISYERKESFMSKSRWLAAAALAALAGTASLPAGLAKPPDLPVDDRISCPDGREHEPLNAVADRADHPRSAGQLFEAAEASRRRGDREAARVGYEEVHLLDP